MNPGAELLAVEAGETLERVLQVLHADGIAVLPTETLYGFSCLAHSHSAIQRIQALKGITHARGFVALVDSLDRLEAYLAADQEPRTLEFLRRIWPEALTAVVRVNRPVPWGDRLHGHDTAAFRVPKHAWLLEVLERIAVPLVSTSVNRSGLAPLCEIEDIAGEFGAGVDLIVAEQRKATPGEPGNQPSTVVDCTSWPPHVLRAGRFDCEQELRRRRDA